MTRTHPIGYPRNLITPDEIARHREAILARREGRPSAYDLPADLVRSIRDASERR